MSLSRADMLGRLASLAADYGVRAVFAELGAALDRAGKSVLASDVAALARNPSVPHRDVEDELARMADAEEGPSRCSCGREHALPDFLALPPAAGGPVGDDGVERLAYRNCPCGSTMARGILVGRGG